MLALFIYLGRNWARVLVLIVSTISIVSAFVSWWAQGQQLTLDGSLTTLALDILVLLALSSWSFKEPGQQDEQDEENKLLDLVETRVCISGLTLTQNPNPKKNKAV